MFIILKTELRISTTGKHVYEITQKNDKIIQIDQIQVEIYLQVTGLQNIVLFHYKRVTNLYLLVCPSNLFVCVQ